MSVDGFLNFLKPPGMTSHDAVAWLRHRARVAVGHTGTLDRAAAGVLVMCVGGARRFSRWAMEGAKAYVGEITFGVTTETLDADGALVGCGDASALTATAVGEALARFVGEIEQQAPAFSAVHADGMRLHEMARKGVEPPSRSRMVSITSAQLLDFQPGHHPRARIAVECSKGTYIRSLAADLGAALGCGACLSFLVRTRSGVFDISAALTVEAVDAAVTAGRLADSLQPLDAPLHGYAAVTLEEREAYLARHGNVVDAPKEVVDDAELVRVYGPGGDFISLAQLRDHRLRPRVVIAE